MLETSIENAIKDVDDYLLSDAQYPFFLVVGDEGYLTVKDTLSGKLQEFVNTSEYCETTDKRPDIDELCDKIRHSAKNIAITGLGEYLSLCGKEFAKTHLSTMKDLFLEHAKAVLILRGICDVVEDFCSSDPRFDNRRVAFAGDAYCNIAVTFIVRSIGFPGPALNGVKSLLYDFENGKAGCFLVVSDLIFDKSLFSFKSVQDIYDVIKLSIPDFLLPHSSGNDEQWNELLSELTQSASLQGVFSKFAISDKPENQFSDFALGNEFKHWLYFIALKHKQDTIDNSYLRYALENSNSFDDFKHSVLMSILNIKPNDALFIQFYNERKLLIKEFTESDLAGFVSESKRNPADSFYYLTDNTLIERQAIIECICQNSNNLLLGKLAENYRDLNAYLRRYNFNCGELSETLTRYFVDYKRQKMLNVIYPEFKDNIQKLAQSGERIYNDLDTREEIIDNLDKKDVFLYWLDALGVEFLGFIQEKCAELGFEIKIHIARAILPTITAQNRGFFDTWNGDKYNDKSLDEVKHKDEGGYDYQKTKLPIHLAKELEIISRMLDFARTKLESHAYKKILLTSDHGASRLAVINGIELKYNTDTKGKHSGRCCPYFECNDLENAVNETGYWVLADYGRFKGSRAANVEVHGGAALEEIVIPVIEITLKGRGMQVEILTSTVISSFKKAPEIILFSKSRLEDVFVSIDDKSYKAEKDDENHYRITLHDIKRSGNYIADVFAGDNRIGQVEFCVQKESAQENKLL